MANVNEGITIEGQTGPDAGVNSEAGFEAALAAKVTRDREPDAAPAEQRSAPVAADLDTAAAIKSQLLGNEGSTSVKDGLSAPSEETDKHGRTPAERQRIHEEWEALQRDPAFQANVAEGARSLEQGRAESLELADLREEKAVADYWTAVLEDGEDDASALAKLKANVSPDAVEGVLYEIFGLDDGYAEEDDERWILMANLDEQADLLLADERHQAMRALEQYVAQRVTETTIRQTKTMANEWARGEGIAAKEANARIARVEQEFGMGLVELAQQFGVRKTEDILRSMDSTLIGEEEAVREYSFKERMLAEPSTSVSEGLTINAGLGDVPLVPRPPLAPRMNHDRVVRRATRNGRVTPADIKRELMAQSPAEAEYAQVQRLAGEMAEAARPKPVKGF